MDDQNLRQAGVATHTGFPNAAIGAHTKQLDITGALIKHPVATYLMRLDSDEWSDLGMYAGDLVVIDRSLQPRPTDTIVWWQGEEFVMSHKSKVPIDTPTWGVVTAVIHQLRFKDSR